MRASTALCPWEASAFDRSVAIVPRAARPIAALALRSPRPELQAVEPEPEPVEVGSEAEAQAA